MIISKKNLFELSKIILLWGLFFLEVEASKIFNYTKKIIVHVHVNFDKQVEVYNIAYLECTQHSSSILMVIKH